MDGLGTWECKRRGREIKAVIYVRVSSSSQAGNTSCGTQEAACRQCCEDHELEVDRIFVEEGESAKSDDRTEFQRTFRYLETVGNRISHLLVWKLDRFARNVEDMAIYTRRLRGLGMSLVSVAERADHTPMGRAMQGIASVFDQLDNENRAVRANISMKATFKSGRWCWSAPIGYLSMSKPERCLKADPVRGPMVVRLFEMISSGQVKESTALAQLTRLGLRSVRNKPLSQETVNRLLRNQLYCGRMYAKAWNLRLKGDFTPLISEELFDRVQAVLDGRAVVTVDHKRQNEDFPLEGSLRCPICNALVTGGKSTGRLKVRYPFDRCYKESGHFNVRAEKVEAALETLLMKLEPEPERMNVVVGLFRSIWKERTEINRIESDEMKAQLRRLETKSARLLDLLAEGVITNAAFKSTTDPLLREIESLRQELTSQRFDELDTEDAVLY